MHETWDVGTTVSKWTRSLIGVEAGITEGHPVVGGVVHTITRRDESETDEASVMIIASPYHADTLSATVNHGIPASVLPRGLFNAWTSAFVVG